MIEGQEVLRWAKSSVGASTRHVRSPAIVCTASRRRIPTATSFRSPRR